MARRVASLLPSASEVLCLVGGEALLVGRSHECDHPASIAGRPILTAANTSFTTSAEVDRTVSVRAPPAHVPGRDEQPSSDIMSCAGVNGCRY
mmetsp:Transcript_19732/g.62772  ORF Transcript_19732/g.62772 Transcript_19732/m.62772 type:complete len:93 (+) Transcript_19732:612-890(+)